MPKIQIYDTTLRDGTQGEGVSLSCDDKLRIARKLDELGVDFIEGGWPGSNPKDAEFFERAKQQTWKHATITAFGSTCRTDVAAKDDTNVQALLASGTEVCTIFGKSWMLQVTDVLRTTAEENLRIIEETIQHLVTQGRRVIYDAEHFFDGYRADADYALQTLRAAIRGGAETLVLCDTNGGSLPWQVDSIIRDVIQKTNHPVGVHTHDDAGCGVANALAAVRAGARHVQGTINGIGERCGNANLCAILPALELKQVMDSGDTLHSLPQGSLEHLTATARFVTEVANLTPNRQMAYVGRSAFAHKGGVHVAAMRRNADAYQHIDPQLVGNEMRVVVSELSGRGNVLSKAEELEIDASPDVARQVVEDIKSLEAMGYSFEAAEASIAMMVRRRNPDYQAPFRVLDYKVTVSGKEDGSTLAEAVVKVAVGGAQLHTAAEGDGPVEALDRALRKAIRPEFPHVREIHLTDYKVRILNSAAGTGAVTRVLIDSASGPHSASSPHKWSTVGASDNIITASCTALIDSLEYGLFITAESNGNRIEGTGQAVHEMNSAFPEHSPKTQ